MNYQESIAKIKNDGFIYYLTKDIFSRKFICKKYTSSCIKRNSPNLQINQEICYRITKEEYNFLNLRKNKFLSIYDQILCEKIFTKYRRNSTLKKIGTY